MDFPLPLKLISYLIVKKIFLWLPRVFAKLCDTVTYDVHVLKHLHKWKSNNAVTEGETLIFSSLQKCFN